MEAAEHLALFLREAQGVNEDQRRKAREMLDEAERHVATLVISTDHQGTEVLVDGVSIGTSPLGREIFILPGRHVIQARLDGFRSAREERTFIAADHSQVDLQLTKVAETPAPAVPNAAQTKLDSTEQSEAAPYRNWVIGAGAGTAGVATILGIVFTVKANMAAADAQGKVQAILDNSPTLPAGTPYCRADYNFTLCSELGAILSAQQNYQNIAIAGYIVGGVATVGTLAFAYLSRSKPQKATSPQIAPLAFSLRERSGGLLLSGTF